VAEVTTQASEVRMPKLSDSMEEGTIIRWLKQAGETVTRGEELVEIETDKATIAYEAEANGPLTIVAGDGETVAVGAVIGRIGAGGDDGARAEAAAPPPPATNGDAAGSANAAPVGDADAERPARSAKPPERGERAQGSTRSGGARTKASPVARRLAQELGVELSALSGSGPGGRVVKRDVEAASGGRQPQASTALAPGPRSAPAREGGAKGQVEVLQATSVQRTIARRMAEAKATVPEFTLSTEVGVDAVLQARGELKRIETEAVPSINDFVVKACALALRRHPRVNGSYRDGHFELYGRINIGVAVAAPDALLVPTVPDADTKSLGQIAAEIRELAERARAGRLTPAELSGGTFTVSNLGMYGVTAFTAIINPPQAAILAVGSIEERVGFADGVPVPRHVMTMTLSCDHRILYGADAALFLKDVRDQLEQPIRMLL
jgi:pyruvate dehydrogenase E2 component (dihydrolipoamide acetyltransferase)